MRPQDLDCNAQGLLLPVTHGELTRNDRGEYFIVTETCGSPEPTCTIEYVNGLKAITCLRCGLTSFNPNDIAQRYCGRCHVFHDRGTVGTVRWTPLDEMPFTEGQRQAL